MTSRNPTRSGRTPTSVPPRIDRESGPQARPGRPHGRRSSALAQRARRRLIWIRTSIGTAIAVMILLIVFLASGQHKGANGYPYQVGQPATGTAAPTFDLASDTGGSFDLAAQHGQTLLMYFQEGIDCEPCWTQLKAMQHDMAQFRASGINEVVSITTDPLSAIKQKASDEGITIPVLSDPDLAVSHQYDANGYGMMGSMMDGHTMMVVGPDGHIEWRADYGGAPNYTMYVPDSTLLAQMKAGMAKYMSAG